MKIIYYAHSLLNRGGDRMVLAHVGRLVAHGHNVELCCNEMNTVLNIPDGVRLSRPSLPGKFGTILSAVFGRRDADVVLASIIPMACFLFPRSRRKVVYFAQDYNENLYPTFIQKLIIRLFYLVGLQFFRIPVVAVSEQLAEIFRAGFQAQVKVVLNGVDMKIFFPEPSDELVAVKNGRKAILFFSRRDLRKGFDLSLIVLNRLAVMGLPPCEIWTVGEPLDDGDINLPCHNFGYVDEAVLRRIYSSADLLLYPSRNEGFPLMPLEAFACGCPVVTTTAVPYAVHMFNALVTKIEDCDALTNQVRTLLIDDDKLRSQLVEAGRMFARRHSLTESSTQFESALVSMVEL